MGRTYGAPSGLAENEVTAVADLQDRRLLLGHNSGLTLLNRDGAGIEKALAIRKPVDVRSLTLPKAPPV